MSFPAALPERCTKTDSEGFPGLLKMLEIPNLLKFLTEDVRIVVMMRSAWNLKRVGSYKNVAWFGVLGGLISCTFISNFMTLIMPHAF